MSSTYTSYGIHTDHNLETRSWVISRHSAPPRHDELEVIWSSKRSLDRENDEIVEYIERRNDNHTAQFQIHTPIKGWYLLITCPSSRAFKTAQKQSSYSKGKSYVNLIPSRTHPSIEFKLHLVHASSSSSSLPTSKKNKRKSYTIVQTDSDSAKLGLPPLNAPGDKTWTTFDGSTSQTDAPSSSVPLSNTCPPSDTSTTQQQVEARQSTFILRPTSHSAAKAQIQRMNESAAHGGSLESVDSNKRDNKRISLRGIANLFSGSDNSFELIWQDDEHNLQIPILIFEDHPSILHTETSGQFHLLTSLITQEFQMPPSNSSESHQQEDTFDPLTFFVTVGIAYLDFLEDQEAYKAAMQD
ncbi:hypothetical protein P389DRAFT_113820 [Cystobasidium minutum MCA 4210]|uniref:uncharacterized protein n=1 Tax=Cystobasidium minutum MCA 4210 TaxID=1397322 RepID=UPI0034CE5573|eukprot:jgi/Rhomi1/113820/CE113819_352